MTVMISNPEDIKRINKALQEISDELTIIEGHKSQIKAIKDTLLEEFEDKLTMKQINKLSKTYHRQNYDLEVAEHEEFEYLYETLTNTSATAVDGKITEITVINPGYGYTIGATSSDDKE